MTRYIKTGDLRDGEILHTWQYTKDTNAHIETAGENEIEVHIPFSQLSATVLANLDDYFTEDLAFIALIDDTKTNPIRAAGPITKYNPIWEEGKLVVIADGIYNHTMGDIVAYPIEARGRVDDTGATWKVSGDSYEDLVYHFLNTSTSETSDGLKFPQCFGPLTYVSGSLSKSLTLVEQKTMNDVLEEIRLGDALVETVFVPQYKSGGTTHIEWVPVVGTKEHPYYNKTTDLGTFNIDDNDKNIVGFSYIADSEDRSPDFFIGTSDAIKKGDNDYTDQTGKWVAAPSTKRFFHRFGSEHFDSELTQDELNTQIQARLQDSDEQYKSYSVTVFDPTFSWTSHLGKTMTIISDTRIPGMSEKVRITGIDWDIDDPSTVTLTVQPRDLQRFPRVPRRTSDLIDKDKKKKGGKKDNNDIAPGISDTDLPDGTIGQNYSASLFASGSPTPTWSKKEGAVLPPGLKMSSSGAITGIPSAKGTFTFGVIAKNRKGTDSADVSITINESGTGDGDMVIPPGFGGDGTAEFFNKIGTSFSLQPLGAYGSQTAVTAQNRAWVLSTGGIGLETSYLGIGFGDVKVKSFKMTKTGDASDLNSNAGTFPGGLLNAVLDYFPTTAMGHGQRNCNVMFDTFTVANRMYVYASMAMCYGDGVGTGDDKTYGFKYQTRCWYTVMNTDGTIDNTWTPAHPAALIEYPAVNFRPLPNGIVSRYGQNVGTVGFFGVQLLRDSDMTYGGQTPNVSEYRNAFLAIGMENDFVTDPAGNVIWHLAEMPTEEPEAVPTKIPSGQATEAYLQRFDTNTDISERTLTTDYAGRSAFGMYVGADGYLYRLNYTYASVFRKDTDSSYYDYTVGEITKQQPMRMYRAEGARSQWASGWTKVLEMPSLGYDYKNVGSANQYGGHGSHSANPFYYDGRILFTGQGTHDVWGLKIGEAPQLSKPDFTDGGTPGYPAGNWRFDAQIPGAPPGQQPWGHLYKGKSGQPSWADYAASGYWGNPHRNEGYNEGPSRILVFAMTALVVLTNDNSFNGPSYSWAT